jgi:hypothetical protein
MLFIAIVSILMFCLCTLLKKEKTPPIETGKYH